MDLSRLQDICARYKYSSSAYYVDPKLHQLFNRGGQAKEKSSRSTVKFGL